MENEFNQFKEIWKAYASVVNCNASYNDTALLIIFRKLMPYRITDITKALDTITSRSGLFSLNVADVLNELKGYNADIMRERASIGFNNVIAVVSNIGTYYSYIFEDVVIDHTLYALGWDMDFINSEECDLVFSRKEFINQYMISAQRVDTLKHLELKGMCNAPNHTKLVSATMNRYGNPVTWVLSEADKETILLGNEESENTVARITAELPKIAMLPNEPERDPTPPASIKAQIEAFNTLANALTGGDRG